MTAAAVILAAGQGERLRAGENKVFALLAGEPVFLRAGKVFASMPEIQEIVFVVRPNEEGRMRELWGTGAERIRWVPGGSTRRDSSLAGVRATSCDVVLIHDAARPFASAELIRRVLKAAQEKGAAIPVLPLVDLLHYTEGVCLLPTEREIPSEDSVVRAQTPQGFSRDRILACLETAGPGVRDDATAVMQRGHPVYVVSGDPCNIKLTHPEDLALAEAIVLSRQRA